MRVNPFPLKLPREFFLRAYWPDSTTLAFRSEKSSEHTTHVDLIFEEVVEMHVRPSLDDVTVDLIDGGYSVSTPDFPGGYVLCKRFHYAEDDVDDWDTYTSADLGKYVIKRIYHPSPGP